MKEIVVPGRLINLVGQVAAFTGSTSRSARSATTPRAGQKVWDAATIDVHRLRSHILMDAGELGSRNLSVNWIEVPPGASEELRSHEEAEQAYVVCGTGTMSATGDTRSSPRRPRPDPPATDHSVANGGAESLALVSVQSPGSPPTSCSASGWRARPSATTATTTRSSARSLTAAPRPGEDPGPGARRLLPRHPPPPGRVARRRGPANRGDGTVEAVLEGRESDIEALIGFCRQGPARAEVEDVDVTPEPPEGLAGSDRVTAAVRRSARFRR